MRECYMCRKAAATTHFQHGDHIKSICDKCLEDNDLNMDDNCRVSDAFRIVNPLATDEQGKVAQECSACGLTVNKFAVNMRVGCRECYTAFAGIVGVVAAPMEDDIGNDILSEQLTRAINEERYEDAADIRDLMVANDE